MDPPVLLPVAEAAIRLGITRERVIRLVQTRQLGGRRDPRRGWLVDETSLNDEAMDPTGA